MSDEEQETRLFNDQHRQLHNLSCETLYFLLLQSIYSVSLLKIIA